MLRRLCADCFGPIQIDRFPRIQTVFRGAAERHLDGELEASIFHCFRLSSISLKQLAWNPQAGSIELGSFRIRQVYSSRFVR